MNISEFERTKPVKTLKKVNELIKLLKYDQETGLSRRPCDYLTFVEQIKEHLKKGE